MTIYTVSGRKGFSMFNVQHPIFMLRLKTCFLSRLKLLREWSVVNKGWYKLLILNRQFFELSYRDLSLFWCLSSHRTCFRLFFDFFSLCRNSHGLRILVMCHDNAHIQISFFLIELLDRRSCLN
jgi:hypothetical protein